MLEWLASTGSAGAFVARHWDVIAFYLVAVILIYTFRKKFEFQGIVALFKTQFGVKFMTNLGKKHPKLWDRVGLVAIVIGYIGMAFITAYILFGLYQLIFVPDAPPALSPVIPGVKIPGVPFTFPLWYTLGALFFAIIVHEAMHGIMSSAYNIKIKSSGFAFLGPIPGAFVEPDEKTMEHRTRRQQLAVVAAGPFANVVLAIIALALLAGVGTVADKLVIHDGVSYDGLSDNSAARIAGMPDQGVITAMDGVQITTVTVLSEELSKRSPGQDVIVTADLHNYRVTLGANPSDESGAFLGVLSVKGSTSLKNPSMGWLVAGLGVFLTLLLWTYIISLGVGIANLLPIFMIDGGRMALLALESFTNKEKAKGIWTRASTVLLVLVIILVFVPIARAIF